jgi:RimJ/RimL family protein N-acetyltransferase
MEALIQIRAATPDDAAMLLRLRLALDSESSFMLFEPGERSEDEADQRRAIEQITGGGSLLLLAIAGERAVGVIEVLRKRFRRNRHSAELNIGVLSEFGGRGIGERLLASAMEWCTERGVTRLSLSVMVHNDRARRLYERAGFVIEGTRRRSLIVDGEPVDEVLMAKLFE